MPECYLHYLEEDWLEEGQLDIPHDPHLNHPTNNMPKHKYIQSIKDVGEVPIRVARRIEFTILSVALG